ncbi:MAG: hypothetical protein FWB85_04695 [Chitinispirillia bacterium]|nr:hypothetical protein [Chitinispirillia bacterium]MCL2241617.1 hypothetical protein [Chitinispirillia bacterium]
MRVAITVTAIFDLPDDVVIKDSIAENGSLTPYFVVNEREVQPYLEFAPVDEEDDGSDEEMGEIYEILDDSLTAEQYTIINVDGDEED